MSLRKGVTTGLLGYSLRKERLGEGLFAREVETFNLDVQVSEFDITNSNAIQEIQDGIKDAFSSYSGDINVKVLGAPTEYSLPNDSVRIGKFNVQVENRKAANISYSNLTGYYSHIDSQGFWDAYSNNLNSFTEEYSFEKNENGNLLASHNVSFTLWTGNKSVAATIASGLFANDTTPTYAEIGSQIGSYSLLDANNVQQFYTETFDLLKNSYSFSKKVEYPPFGSDSSFSVKKNLSHSLELGEDGIINVTERGEIKAFKVINQAKSEFEAMKANGQIFSRCNEVYNAFRQVVGNSNLSLKNFPVKSDYVINAPALSCEYNVSYSDNPQLVENKGVTIEKGIEVSMSENRSVNITNNFNFVFLKKVNSNMETENNLLINDALNETQSIVDNYYQNSPYYNTSWPTLSRIKSSLSLPNRARNFGVSFGYINEPIYNKVVEGVTYKKFDYRISDTKPVDIVNEYKVINRPSKTSVLNYAYQTEKGERNIEITAMIERDNSTLSVNPIDFNVAFYPLYKFAAKKIIESFKDSRVASFTYHISDIKCSLLSNYEFSLTLTVEYTLKKFVI